MPQPILIVVGTRPEGIKMIPVYYALKNRGLNVLLCSTSQHKELLASVFTTFNLKPDFDLNCMTRGQDLFDITCSLLLGVREVIRKVKPSLVLVQGDTTTAMATALAAFYLQISVGHVEAGLRTNDLYAPFPEEMNRRFISLITRYHFAPTAAAAAHVLSLGAHRDTVFCTGNTVIDALYMIQDKIASGELTVSPSLQERITYIKSSQHKLALFTMHRRESWQNGIEHTLTALMEALNRYPDLTIIYPYHPNPIIQNALQQLPLASQARLFICPPLPYADLVYVLSHCDWVMTDSGGLQEEATCLGKPALILREQTERMEGVWVGLARVVGTQPTAILHEIDALMHADTSSNSHSAIYGDGQAAGRIAQIIAQNLEQLENSSQRAGLQQNSTFSSFLE
jgi:UDP-N-acetylglucosamine 2-epimerase (non-hydrolysing)